MSQAIISTIAERFPQPEWPEFVSVTQEGGSRLLQLNIYPEIHWFIGHFPSQAVLAGVVQTHWAAELGKYFFPLGDAFQQLDNLKFQNVILPDRLIMLRLNYDDKKNTLKFQFFDDTLNYSEGKFVFGKRDLTSDAE